MLGKSTQTKTQPARWVSVRGMAALPRLPWTAAVVATLWGASRTNDAPFSPPSLPTVHGVCVSPLRPAWLRTPLTPQAVPPAPAHSGGPGPAGAR